MSESTGWRQLEFGEWATESAIQNAFDCWDCGRGGSKFIGIPTCLPRHATSRRARFTTIVGSVPFRPDVVWDGSDFAVAELKGADTYADFSDLALAQVLFYAWNMQRRGKSNREDAAFPTPVIVMHSSYFMRGALSYLHSHGFDKRALRYIEATGLLDLSNGERCVLLYEPFSDWLPVPRDNLPACIRQPWRTNSTDWYRVDGAPSWAGVVAGSDVARPEFPAKCVFVSQFDSGRPKYLVEMWDRSTDLDAYYLWEDEIEGKLGDSCAPVCPIIHRR